MSRAGSLRWTEDEWRDHCLRKHAATRAEPIKAGRALGNDAPAAAKSAATSPRPSSSAARSKYRNRPTNGYASKREAKRAQQLKLAERAGEITDLREQVKFELIPAQYADGKCVERPCSYVADFTYVYRGQRVVEDAKGMRPPVYVVKRKLMLHVHGIRVAEV